MAHRVMRLAKGMGFPGAEASSLREVGTSPLSYAIPYVYALLYFYSHACCQGDLGVEIIKEVRKALGCQGP